MPDSETTDSHSARRGPSRRALLSGPPRSRFSRGVELGFPIFLGYVPVGMAFGILARTLGFSVLAGGRVLGDGARRRGPVHRAVGAGQRRQRLDGARRHHRREPALRPVRVDALAVPARGADSTRRRRSPSRSPTRRSRSTSPTTDAGSPPPRRCSASASSRGSGWVLGTLLGARGRRLDRRPVTLRRRLRDARDVHGAVRRARRGSAPRRHRTPRRRDRARCCRSCRRVGRRLVFELVHRDRVDGRGHGRRR